jgi:hypothetical protein
MKTQKEIRTNFWQMLQETAPDLAKLKRAKKRQNDYPADIRCAFVEYTDYLQKNGVITQAMADKTTL